MIKLGITGGIGSGKSTVSEIFKLMGIPVYIADIESKKLTASSPIIRQKLIEEFGKDLYDGTTLNKALLASYIFTDKNNLEKANRIIHPEVDKHFSDWAESHSAKPLIAVEAAILYESGMNRFTDKVLMVYTPLEERIRRVMARDNSDREKVVERIDSQMPDEEKMKRADFVIYNNEAESLIEQSLNIISELTENER